MDLLVAGEAELMAPEVEAHDDGWCGVACLFRCGSGEGVLSRTKSSYQFEGEKNGRRGGSRDALEVVRERVTARWCEDRRCSSSVVVSS